MSRKLNIIIIGLLTTIMAAAVPYCDIRKFSITDGLAANTIADLKQGKDKLMWFGTWNGISYYDGYTFHTFRDEPDNEDILSTNRILQIEPTTNNNLWCVTNDRQLYVYDTHICQFVQVGKEINKKYGIYLRVKNIYALNNGRIWITSDDGDYAIRAIGPVVNDKEPELIRVGQKGLRSGKIWFVHSDKRGREWVMTDKGTMIYGHKFSVKTPYKWIREVGEQVYLATTDGKLAMVDERDRLTNVPLPPGITRINELKNTGYQLLLATNLGLVIYNPRSFKAEIINIQSPGQPLAEAKKLYTDYFGMVWVFTEGMGVTLVNPKNNTKQWLFADQPDPVDRTTSDSYFITQDENHVLWVVPNGGTFSYFDRSAGKLVPYLLRSNSSGNYRIPRIGQYALSDQGVLWITGIHDLTQIAFKNHSYTLTKLSKGESEVRAIAAIPNGNHLYGYKDGFLQVTDANFRPLGYMLPNGQITQEQVQFSTCGIYSLFVDTRSRLWVGTNYDGIYMLDHGKTVHFLYNPADKGSLPSNNIYDVRADRQGRIWIASYGGGIALVNEHADGSINFISNRNGLSWPKGNFQKTRRIECTNDGDILVATTDGLITFSDNFKSPSLIKCFNSHNVEGDTTSLEANDVLYIMEHSTGKMFISELGGVMERIISKNLLQNNLKVEYFKNISTAEGLVKSMQEDNDGNIWIIRESSIDKVNLKKGTTEVFGPNDFDYNLSFTEARPYHDPATNNITVGTPMGALTFNPATLKKSTYQARIIFTNLHFNGEIESHPILHAEKVVIPANKRNLTISFAALDYTRKYQSKYLYRLEGSTPDGEWIPLGSNNTIGFNHISHGNYILKVKGTNSHGVWSKYVAELLIEVRPTFWESIWGRLVLLLLLSAIVGSIFYSYNQRQRQNINHEMSVMKNEFFSDASHRLRTPLTLIGGPVQQVLANEPGLTKQSKDLLGIVLRNSHEMLDMINKILRFDNSQNFYTNGGMDENDTEELGKEIEGQIDDKNAQRYLEEENKKREKEEERLEEHGEVMEHEKKDITLLVVEDNADLRKYLYNILESNYNVLLAENGKAGLLMARKEMPDFILTDVTMPVMDGITMVHHIKQDSTLKNIPIIILSAKASVEDQLRGFEEGIDAYLTKPFSVNYLLARIEAVITKRRAIQTDLLQRLREAGDKDAIAALRILPAMRAPAPNPQSTSQTAEPEKKEHDATAFMSLQINDAVTEKIMRYILDHISSPDLKIDEIAQAVGMSRSVLYSKIKQTVGMTPIDFVRHIRIMKATEMLQDTDESLSNIAYNVGFSDPKYFSKVFKREMGIIPSEYRERTRQA